MFVVELVFICACYTFDSKRKQMVVFFSYRKNEDTGDVLTNKNPPGINLWNKSWNTNRIMPTALFKLTNKDDKTKGLQNKY